LRDPAHYSFAFFYVDFNAYFGDFACHRLLNARAGGPDAKTA
jgi:hypothetical protein